MVHEMQGSIKLHEVDRNGNNEDTVSTGSLSHPFASLAGTFTSPE